MISCETVEKKLFGQANAEKAAGVARFFKAEPGGYAEGDVFLGLSVPDQRKVAKELFDKIPLSEIEKLLRSEYHECRLTSLFILALLFSKSGSTMEREAIVNLYLQNLSRVNNWDLVDSSADKILGAWLWDKPRDLLYKLAVSDNLWFRRISIISTFYFIRKNEFTDTLALSEILLQDKHDLIHKAVGWMLRETGNRDLPTELGFLNLHYKVMPRTMLRYAIEKFEEPIRQNFLKGKI